MDNSNARSLCEASDPPFLSYVFYLGVVSTTNWHRRRHGISVIHPNPGNVIYNFTVVAGVAGGEPKLAQLLPLSLPATVVNVSLKSKM